MTLAAVSTSLNRPTTSVVLKEALCDGGASAAADSPSTVSGRGEAGGEPEVEAPDLSFLLLISRTLTEDEDMVGDDGRSTDNEEDEGIMVLAATGVRIGDGAAELVADPTLGEAPVFGVADPSARGVRSPSLVFRLLINTIRLDDEVPTDDASSSRFAEDMDRDRLLYGA
eukprot:ANDGO_06673.mRNA.1 hypothetical protein